MDTPSELAERPGQAPAVLKSLVAWQKPAAVARNWARLKNRAHEASAALGKQMRTGGLRQRFHALRLTVKLIGLLFGGKKRIDKAVRDLAHGQTELKLSEWLAYAEACGMPIVPYELGPKVTQEAVEETYKAIQASSYDALPTPVKEEVLPWIQALQEKGWMWRFEFCAPETIKEVLGCIRPKEFLTTNRVKVPFSVDERVLHCMWGFGLRQDEATHLIARPWIPAQFEAGFPVEFRVYRTPEGFAACNYYLQRPLPETYRPKIEEAIRLTQTLEDRAKAVKAGDLPPFPKTYTVDWLLTPAGDLLIIEAGTGFGHGAHPCCFDPNRVQAGRVLLKQEPGSVLYCPDDLQLLVDRIKQGEHPLTVGQENGVDPMTLIAFAAIQGDVLAQRFTQYIDEAQTANGHSCSSP